jgi:hypothetical protein
MFLKCEPAQLGAIKRYIVMGCYKGSFRVFHEHAAKHVQSRWDFAPIYVRERTPASSDRMQKYMVVLHKVNIKPSKGFLFTYQERVVNLDHE